MIARLNETETKLAETEARAKQSRSRNARLLAQIETYKKTVEDLKATAEQQKTDYEAQLADKNTQITTLAGKVDTLTTENTDLTVAKTALTDTVVNLTAYKNTVYYAIGTKDELMKKGVVTKEGSKFLVFGGTRLEPARNLDPGSVHRDRQDQEHQDRAASYRQEVQDHFPAEPDLSGRGSHDEGREGDRESSISRSPRSSGRPRSI